MIFILLSVLLHLTTSQSPQSPQSPLWVGESEIVIRKPEVTACQHRCSEFDKSVQLSVIVKSRNICKCVNTCKTCTKYQCANLCSEDERLEGALWDVCNFIDNVCYTYKYVKEY